MPSLFASKNPKSVGEILVGLRWKKDKETLDVTIQEASSLRIMDQDKRTSSKSNTYITMILFVGSMCQISFYSCSTR